MVVERDEDVLVCDASLASGWGASGVLRRRARSFIAPRGLAGIGWSDVAASLADNDRARSDKVTDCSYRTPIHPSLLAA